MFGVTLTAFAQGDDVTIDAKTREAIFEATLKYIEDRVVKGSFLLYDAVVDELLRLKFERMHAGIRTTEDFHMSCTTFVDKEGTPYDLDFFVVQKEDGTFEVLQAHVHGVDGQKRPHHP
jgi:hypothetical protein